MKRRYLVLGGAFAILLGVLLATVAIVTPRYDLEDRFHVAHLSYSDLRSRSGLYERVAFGRSFARFANVEDCETGRASDETEALNWDVVRTATDWRVCLFLKAEALDSPEEMVEWLERNGFDADARDSHGTWPTQRPVTVYGTYDLAAQDDPVFRSLYFRGARWFERPVSVGVSYNDENTALGTTVVVIWN